MTTVAESTTHYAKVLIEGSLEIVTGLHIGAGDGFSAIGATDSPVVRDPLTKLPLIPGSSLKGKMRTLLARQFGADTDNFSGAYKYDNEQIRRLFGDTDEYMTGRLVFRDTKLSNQKQLEEKGARTLTEVKFENNINRITAKATPRQIERVIAGSKFNFTLIYEISFGYPGKDNEKKLPTHNEVVEDFHTITTGMRLLQLDYIGGSGTRGYGQVKFSELNATVPVGHVNNDLLEKLNDELASL